MPIIIILLPLSALHSADRKQAPEEPVVYQTDVSFHDFPWGTSMQEVVNVMGKPASREEINGLVSLVWDNIDVNGYMTFMLAYFSKTGLEGGTYYFLTYDTDELMRCYSELRQGLRDRFGPTYLFNGILRELRPYECSWNLPGGYVYLMVNTRRGDPVTLWYSSPELSKKIFGTQKPVTAKK